MLREAPRGFTKETVENEARLGVKKEKEENVCNRAFDLGKV